MGMKASEVGDWLRQMAGKCDHREAAGRLPHRAASFDGTHDPLTQVLGQGGSHDQLHRSHPQHPGNQNT